MVQRHLQISPFRKARLKNYLCMSTFVHFFALAVLVVNILFVNCNSEQGYYRKYLDSFPSSYNEKNHFGDHFFNNFTVAPLAIHKYKKVRKKYPQTTTDAYEETMIEPSNVNKNEENYYVGFTKNPFGPSSPIPRSTMSKFFNNSQALTIKEHSGEYIMKDTRGKRGVAQLYNMVSCATGCNPISYKGYGCYCGFLGSGQFTDSIDRCCMLHDLCYNTVDCPLFLEYFMPYLWKCWRGEPLCAIDHLGYGDANSCAARLCECDRQLAVCLSYSPCPVRRALCTSSPLRLLQNLLMFK